MKLIYFILPLMAIGYVLMYYTNMSEAVQWKVYDIARQTALLIMAVIIHKQCRSVKYVVATYSLIVIFGFELLAEILNQNKKGDIGDVLWQILVGALIILTLKSIKWIR